MGQVLHGSATTTAAIRRAIHHSQESLMWTAVSGARIPDASSGKLDTPSGRNATSSPSSIAVVTSRQVKAAATRGSRSAQSSPRRVSRRTRPRLIEAIRRSPLNLISDSQSGPSGALVTNWQGCGACAAGNSPTMPPGAGGDGCAALFGIPPQKGSGFGCLAQESCSCESSSTVAGHTTKSKAALDEFPTATAPLGAGRQPYAAAFEAGVMQLGLFRPARLR